MAALEQLKKEKERLLPTLYVTESITLFISSGQFLLGDQD